MRKLLSANFARLWQSKVFWLILGILFFWGVPFFCLNAMLDSNKARTVTIGMLLAVFLYLGGFATYSGLAEPEFTTRMVTNANGEYEIAENIPNSKYLSDTERVIYKAVNHIFQKT